jgi:peptidoglycan/LPS O-acetylase OafA/YrhL
VSSSASAKRILELDGLRGVAILSVIAGHYFAAPGKGIFRYLDGYWVRLGWTGVDLFFVLSGFLIGGILLDCRGSARYFETFYTRRMFRILPAYYTWILLYILVFAFGRFFFSNPAADVGRASPALVFSQFLFLQNFSSLPAHSLASVWFSVTWSLAVEEQFYLISPWLVHGLSRRYLAVVLGAVIATDPLLRLFVRMHFHRGTWLAYSLMPCRADALAAGMLAALAWRSFRFRRLIMKGSVIYPVVALLSLGVAVIWKWYSDPRFLLTQTVGYTWIATFYVAILLLAISRPGEPIAFLLRCRPLRRLGMVSYSMYIIHLTIFSLLQYSLFHHLPKVTSDVTGAVGLVAMGVCCLLAAISWKYLEHPLLRRGHALAYGRLGG